MNELWTAYLSEKRLRPSVPDKERKASTTEYMDKRNPFESDFGRVIFSAACRRLHDKTQVFPLTTDDNIHSRLTHSMEVMNIGLSFAIDLSENEDFKKKTGLDEKEILRKFGALLKTACLVHDIGNPPFGHFGEESIQHYFTQLFQRLNEEIAREEYNHIIIKSLIAGQEEDQALEPLNTFLKDTEKQNDYTQFDGNAQGFRVLTKLQFLNDLYGLNLTCGSLASTLKYPNTSGKNKTEISLHKHGVFTTEKGTLDAVAIECGLKNGTTIKRHPLAFLMEAADSICYLIMDIEDAINKNWLRFENLAEYLIKNKLTNNVIEDLLAKVETYGEKKPPHRKKVVNFRTVIISYLTDLAIRNFIENLDLICNGEYNEELIEDDPNNIARAIKAFCFENILSKREIQSLEITGNSIICGIIDAYINLLFNENESFRRRGKSLLSKAIVLTTLQEYLEEKASEEGKLKNEAEKADDVYPDFDIKDFTIEQRLRIIRDYVSGMTDQFALNHYRRLSGQQIY